MAVTELVNGVSPMLLVASVRTSLTQPEIVGRQGDIFLRRNWQPKLLQLELLVDPVALALTKGRGRFAPIVDFAGKSALIVTPIEHLVQIDDRVAVVGSERQTEFRQPFF